MWRTCIEVIIEIINVNIDNVEGQNVKIANSYLGGIGRSARKIKKERVIRKVGKVE